MAYPPVFATLPEPSLFSFPPTPDPNFVLPPLPASIPSAPPIAIPDHVYRAVLDPKVPLTIATLYAVTAKGLNAYNRSSGKRPWAISRTRAFKIFVVLHNVLLAVYSAWTWWGMYGALRRTIVSPLGANGLAGFTDSLCQIHGPAGLGRGVFFSEDTKSWQSLSPDVALGSSGGPSRTDMGRIWNEGLAFYGWLFYLSKFYEVLDTFIILAKGKFSSTLQTYHHAGAMLCMWAGMRYMSPPIWVFVFFNSGIHAIMYTYYTLTAFHVKVPTLFKRSLTSLQISQFIVGASCAMVYSFISYGVPVLGQGEQIPVDAEEASPSLIDGFKRIVFGADESGSGTYSASNGSSYMAGHHHTVPCVSSSSATFAIWLNVVYLAPLTYLFVSFFIASYIRRSTAEQVRAKKDVKVAATGTGTTGSRRLSNVTLAEKAGWDAARGVEREVYGQGAEEASAQPPKRLLVNGQQARGKTTKGRTKKA